MLKELYLKYKEVINYLFFGGCTFLVSVVSFYLFNKVLFLNEHLSNILSWILAVLFAYITNKTCVFESKTTSKEELLKEISSFFTARLLTLGIEELILFIFVNIFKFDALIIKIFAQVIVILANYVLSKLFVFKKK